MTTLKKTICMMLACACVLFMGIGTAEDTQAVPDTEPTGMAEAVNIDESGTDMEETENVQSVTGVIIEAADAGGYLLEETGSGRQIQILIGDDTWESAAWAISVGDGVVVVYTQEPIQGDPIQITASQIRSYSEEGTVESVNNDANSLLMNTAPSGQLIVHLPQDAMAADYAGKAIRVYHNGAVAMSEPGQVSAIKVDLMEIASGEITQVDTDTFLMDWEESQLQVRFDEHTKITTEFEVGSAVEVYYNGIMTRSMPGQITAKVIYVTPEPAK